MRWRLWVWVVGLLGVWLVWEAGKEYITGTEPNLCKNTFMHPSYLPVQLPGGSTASRYGLYVYRELSVQENRWNPENRGVPVIFVAGNGGSAKQVRSFGSEAARIGQKLKTAKPNVANDLDFFAVDFNEDLSAFDGQLLWEETKFLCRCIKHILSLYAKHNKGDQMLGNEGPKIPRKVILVGHSMGGMVARAIFTLPECPHQAVDTIITLNTPHRTSPLFVHPSVTSFYDSVTSFWRKEFESLKNDARTASPLANVSMISIAGSFRDTLIRSELTSMDDFLPPSNGFSILTTSIPSVRLQLDNQVFFFWVTLLKRYRLTAFHVIRCILWCNPMALAIARCLHGLIDPSTKQATLPLYRRLKVFKNEFYSYIPESLGMQTVLPPFNATKTLPNTFTSISSHNEAVVVSSPHLHLRKIEHAALRFDLSHRPEESFVIITNLERGAHFKVLIMSDENQAQDITAFGFAIPSVKKREIYVGPRVPGPEYIPAHADIVSTNISVYRPCFAGLAPTTALSLSSTALKGKRYLLLSFEPSAVRMPSNAVFFYASFLPEGPAQELQLPQFLWDKGHSRLEEGHPLLTNFSVSIPDVHYPLSLSIVPSLSQGICKQANFAPTVYMIQPETGDELFFINQTQISVNLHRPTTEPLALLLFSDPDIAYDIAVEYSLKGMMGRMFASYFIHSLAMLFIIHFLCLAFQFSRWGQHGTLPSLLNSAHEQAFRSGLFFVVLLPLIEWCGVMSLLKPFCSRLFAQLPYPLGDHSFTHMAEDAAPLWAYSVLYAVGLFVYLGLIILVSAERLIAWGIISCWTTIRKNIFRAVRKNEERVENAGSRLLIRIAFLVFTLALTFTCHSFVALAVSFVYLLCHSARSRTEPNHSHYVTSMLVQHKLILLCMGSSAVIWIRQLDGPWQFIDSFETLTCSVLLHTALLSSASVPKSSHRIMSISFYAAAVLMAVYGLFLWYRCLHLVQAHTVAFLFYHCKQILHSKTE